MHLSKIVSLCVHRTPLIKPSSKFSKSFISQISSLLLIQRDAAIPASSEGQESPTVFPKWIRIPVQHEEEVKQVLEDYNDAIQEFAETLNCNVSAVKQMVRRDTRIVTLCSKQNIIHKIKFLLHHGFNAKTIMSR